MQLWLIPIAYVVCGFVVGFELPRLEYAYMPHYGHDISVGSAQAYLSAVSSGMITLTAVVFSIVFVMLQFTTTAYSKRLFQLFAGHPLSLHALGMFVATFMCALGVLEFVDRNHSGQVPLLSIQATTALLVLSMVLLAMLIRRIGLLRITYILQYVGDQGRAVIVALLPRADDEVVDEVATLRAQAEAMRKRGSTQRVVYGGTPRAVAKFRIDACVRLAERADCTIAMHCGVGDTIAQGTLLLEVFGATAQIPEDALLRCIDLAPERTFEQDPKYPLRLLVDTAIMALSPAVNDPTTAVQAIDQIEDLLNRLGRRILDSGFVKDANGKLRLVFPMPTWDEYLSLAFDEIRAYGADSLQVHRRRSAISAGP